MDPTSKQLGPGAVGDAGAAGEARQKQRRWWQRRPGPPRTGWQRVRRFLLDLAILGVLALGISFWQGRSLLGSGAPAPAFSLTTTTGQRITTNDLKGQKTLLAFWAPWCGVCGAESDNLSRIQSWLGGRVRVVSVVLDQRGEGDVQAFMTEQEVDYPVLIGNPAIAAAYQVKSYPTIYVLDAEGRIEHAVVGYTTTAGLLGRVLF